VRGGGAQAALTAAFDASQRAAAAAAGEPAERQGRGIALQIAFARRESHHKAARHVGLAKVLRDEMPYAGQALRDGKITEWVATLLAPETSCLAVEQRREIDRLVAGDPERLAAMGDREVVAAARDLACRLDPASVAERRRQAEADRHTSLRPARPREGPRQGRADQRAQRGGPVRGVQLRQAGPRLEREATRRPRPHDRDHHPDRASLPLHRPDHRASAVDGDLPRHRSPGPGRIARPAPAVGGSPDAGRTRE
jgi:hypothetical protein